MDDWDRIERQYLSVLLDPNRVPSRDPFWECVMSIGSRKGVGAPPLARIDLSEGAWGVICRSPSIESMGVDPSVPERSDCSFTEIMGIPVRIAPDLPSGVVAFIASDGDIVRMVVLTDLD